VGSSKIKVDCLLPLVQISRTSTTFVGGVSWAPIVPHCAQNCEMGRGELSGPNEMVESLLIDCHPRGEEQYS